MIQTFYPMRKLIVIVVLVFASVLANGQNAGSDNSNLEFLLSQDTTIHISYTTKKDNGIVPAYFVNNMQVSHSALSTILQNSIEKIRVEKDSFLIDNREYHGKIFVELKEGFEFKPIPLGEFERKYLDLPQGITIFSIDGNTIEEDYSQFVVNERGIYKIEVNSVIAIDDNTMVNVVNLITRTESNIKNSEKILLKGKQFLM